jgi:hypothetical protein
MSATLVSLRKLTVKKKKGDTPTAAVSAAARAMNHKRWKDVPEKERIRIATWVASHGAGRPRSKAARCPCGNMTLKLAKTRAGVAGTGLGHKEGCRFFRDHRLIVR